MLDTIILLTSTVEQPVLAATLQGHNPLLTVYTVATLAELMALAPDVLRRARLIAFCTDVVVPARLLDALGFGAYNFHPGSPRYPGWAPAQFAIYEQAKEFGATAHVMIAEVDAGPIVDVEMFDVAPGITLLGLGVLAYTHTAKLFWRLAWTMALQREVLPQTSIRWSGEKCTRRRYAAMRDIPDGISPEERDRRTDAFAGAVNDAIVAAQAAAQADPAPSETGVIAAPAKAS
jgi:hypothetical protein